MQYFEGEDDGHPREGFERNFTFDYSYSSFDRSDPEYATQVRWRGYVRLASGAFLMRVPPVPASQAHVFNDLGQFMLKNAWDGYNCSLFAYGERQCAMGAAGGVKRHA